MDSNEEEGVCYPQPATLADRVAIASDFVESCAYEIPIAIDPVDNPADQLYAAWPERIYIVDVDGTIAYKGETGPFGYHPDAVAAWLLAVFPPAVLPPSDVSAERVASEPLSVRAVEYADSRERWRLAIEPSRLATVGRGDDAKSFEVPDDRLRALRAAIADGGFFSWKEATGIPNVKATTRTLAIGIGADTKVVHRYSFPRDEDEEAPPAADETEPDVAGFEALWELVRALDAR